MRNSKQVHIVAVVACVISVMIVVASLFFPALILRAPNGNVVEYPSWPCFFFGWVGLLSVLDGHVDRLGWLANVTLMLAVLDSMNRQYRAPVIYSAIGVGLAMMTFLMKDVWLNEAGTKGVIVGHGVGFYLWMVAIALNLITSAVVYGLWLNVSEKNHR